MNAAATLIAAITTLLGHKTCRNHFSVFVHRAQEGESIQEACKKGLDFCHMHAIKRYKRRVEDEDHDYFDNPEAVRASDFFSSYDFGWIVDHFASADVFLQFMKKFGGQEGSRIVVPLCDHKNLVPEYTTCYVFYEGGGFVHFDIAHSEDPLLKSGDVVLIKALKAKMFPVSSRTGGHALL